MNLRFRWRIRRWSLVAVLLAVATLGGCPPPDDDGDGNGQPTPDESTLIGIWQHQGASILANQIDGEITFLVFNEDGTAKLLSRNEDTGILGCHEGTFAALESVAILAQFPSLGDTELLLASQDDADSLELIDALGGTSTFSRATAVPAAADCRTFEVVRRFTTGLPQPSGFSGLAFDGTSLLYKVQNGPEIAVVNPATGVAGVPLNPGGSFVQVHATQGTDFWAHCACGNVEDVQRRTQAGTNVDTVNTRTDLGNQISVRGIAYDGVGNVLWLHGFSFDDGVSRFLRVNSDAEPDVLLTSRDFDAFINSMTWDGTRLWALVGFGGDAVIAEIDVTTFLAVATYKNPDRTIQWQGIAAVNGNLFLLGRNNTNNGVLFEVAP